MSKKLKVGSCFTGIGAWEKGFSDLNIDYELKWFFEKDDYAPTAYCAVHGVNIELNKGDITEARPEELDDIDVLVYSPPCQAFSIAGKRLGIKDPRGTLFYYTLPIVATKKPKYALMENVKGLVTKGMKPLFDDMLDELEKLGYNNYWKVLNAKDYGIPQNRERVFVVSIRKDIDGGSFKFPEPFDNGLRLKDLLEGKVDEKYYINNDRVENLLAGLKESEIKICAERGRYDEQSNIRQQLELRKDGNTNTLTTVQKDNMVVEPNELKFIGGIGDRDWVGDGKEFSRNYPQGNRMYDANGIACSQTAQGGGVGSYTGLYLEAKTPNEIEMIEINQLVRVRKYKVDVDNLATCLKDHKEKSKLTNRQIAEALDKPITLVEHWFRRDSSFAIPDEDVWYKLKDLLKIETDKFNLSITEFEEKEGVYEKGNRYYHEKGIAPTLTTSANERIIEESPNLLRLFTNLEGGKWDKMKDSLKRVYNDNGICPTISTCQGGHREPKVHTNYKIRKLTPRECWRLMGFTDEDYFKARKELEDKFYNGGDRSNSQMYKMAGNSIVINVPKEIYKILFREYIMNSGMNTYT